MSILPVRSPFPSSVPSTRSAPAKRASSVAAMPVPRSLCGWILKIMLSRFLKCLFIHSIWSAYTFGVVISTVAGWDDGFSDEGSCYWLGKKALELFSKESDGRVKKGKLLEIFRYNFNLKNDFDLIDIFDEVYKNNRTKTAELQKLLLQAAMQGDEEAIRLYEAAAEELALIIGAVYRKLEFSGDTIVSYSGGLFHAGDFILKPLVRKLEENGICLCPPKYSPVQGAALLAAREYSRDGEFLSRIKAGLE